MITPRLVMILASAGSGKTFTLTNRFIALLAAGASPERIVALTFTRKAAGEFFDGILGKLADASAEADAAGALAREIGRPELDRADFLRLLRAMTESLHQLKLGTLDSFFARVARSFPFELGLGGDFEVLEEHAKRLERRRVLQALFARSGKALEEAQLEFLEAFKRATFGTEEKRLALKMDRFLDEHYETFLAAPRAESWADPRRIWPGAQPWLEEAEDLPRAKAGLRAWVNRTEMSDRHRERWERFLAAVELWAPGAPMSDELTYVLHRVIRDWHRLCDGEAEVKFDRKTYALDAAVCSALTELVRHLAGGEFRRRLEGTRGLHAVLERYDALYDAGVRRAGKLTFADVERLLRPDGSGRRLSFAAQGEGRLLLDYRLDAAIDHWLLDEFQDTSRGQWSVLRNLIDEVVQDPEGRRTFFCVGDVKQSIYGWREGDPTLMRDVRRHYNGAAEEPIATQPLDASWRSGPAVIAMVNAVFGNTRAIEELFPGEASRRWRAEWRAHTTERPQRDGQAALLFAEDTEDRYRQTLALLREIGPLERGLSCAVLVRRNSEATQLADFLRREGKIPAVAESDLCVCTDNALGAALLALVQAAAHPEDTLAWEHVQMSPLGAVLADEGIRTRDVLTRRVLAQIQDSGFERWSEFWMGRLLVSGAFARERARQFAGAAALFDGSGRRDPDEFLQFMSSYAVREPESASVVRVMTIHKSKGLGFDVVILPELQGTKLAAARGGLAVHRDAAREVEWVLDLPPTDLAREDEVLRRHLESAEDEACYEALSLLYVAMTRAKHAMYLLTEPRKPTSSSANYSSLLEGTLGSTVEPVRIGKLELHGPWTSGNPDWLNSVTPPAPAPAARGLEPIDAAPVVRRVARRPSGMAHGELPAALLFSLRQGEAADFGSGVHELLAQVEWCASDAEAEKLTAAWRSGPFSGAVADHAASCLGAAGLARVWTRPGAHAEVWRERKFEVVLDDAWVTGVFDRVVVERDAAGRAVRATVFDFKTDRLAGAADLPAAVARHSGQLTLYRRVAAILLGLPPTGVDAELVFTQLSALAPVPTGAEDRH